MQLNSSSTMTFGNRFSYSFKIQLIFLLDDVFFIFLIIGVEWMKCCFFVLFCFFLNIYFSFFGSAFMRICLSTVHPPFWL